MLKVETIPGGVRVEHSGSLTVVAAESAAVIGSIFNAFKMENPHKAEMYRLAVAMALQPDSPTWNPGDNDCVTICIPKKDKEKGDA